MKEYLVTIAIISLLFGAVLGIAFIALLLILRKYIFGNSIIHLNNSIGRIATVQIPFDYNTKGKIRVRLNKSIKELLALTYYPHKFRKGDKVLIIEVDSLCAWVYPCEENR